MKLDGHPYEVNILGQDNKPVALTGEGYAPLAHGEHYKIELQGSPDHRCAAEISVDGEVIGNFLVPTYRKVVIERPVSVAKLLTFFNAQSDEAKAAMLDNVSADNLGVISVKFVPEKFRRMAMLSMAPRRGDFGLMRGGETKSSGLGAGGTGLSGQSDQHFTTVEFNGDESRAVTLNLRLAFDPARTIAPDVQPLPGRLPKSNPVPPPLGGDGPK